MNLRNYSNRIFVGGIQLSYELYSTKRKTLFCYEGGDQMEQNVASNYSLDICYISVWRTVVPGSN